MELRPYQLDCLEAIQNKFKEGINRQLVVLPTGSGKTVIFSELIKRRNLKTLVIAHRIELLEQAQSKINEAAPDIETGIFCGDRRCHDKQITIASIQSAKNYLKLLKEEDYQLIIIDEAHHAAAKSYKNLLRHLGFIQENGKDRNSIVAVKKLLVGFTATPSRGDGKGLDHVFQEVVSHLSIKKLINQGYLIKPEGLHVTVGIDLRELCLRLGDFEKSQLQRIMLEEKALKVVVNTIKTQASNRRGIVFTVNIEHAEILTKLIQGEGFSCEAVHSKISMEDRQQRLQDFSSGKIQFVVNPMILTEGFDCPRADCMINASPTLNRSLYVQKAGRVLRLHPEKENALLIDFGFSKKRHALKTAIDLYGDAKIRQLREKRELQPSQDQTEKIDFSVAEFKESEREEYNPLGEEAVYAWNKVPNEETYYIQGSGVKMIVKAFDSGQCLVMRHIWDGDKLEPYGYHEKSQAFELAESLAEKTDGAFCFSRNAKWRKDPASKKQLAYLKMLSQSLQVSINFDGITKGKASDYILKLENRQRMVS